MRRNDLVWNQLPPPRHVSAPATGNPPFVPLTVSGAAATDPVIASDDMGNKIFDENGEGDDFADIDAYDPAQDERSETGGWGDFTVPMEGVIERGRGQGVTSAERGCPTSAQATAPVERVEARSHVVPVSLLFCCFSVELYSGFHFRDVCLYSGM